MVTSRFKCSGLSLLMALLALMAMPAQAVILLTGDNSANQTAPDVARTDIFNSVAKVCNGSGGGAYGSAVHLRGKYMLTARHVNIVGANHVTFDGGTIYERDAAFAPIQIGTADLQVFKLLEDPGLPEVKLFDAVAGDLLATATIVGAGLGRDPADPDESTTWNWGPASTLAKRWGTNVVEATFAVTGTYTYEAIDTYLNTTAGDDEAAVVRYDSGCGLFVEHEGEWKLAGIATLVSTISGDNTSTFDLVTNDLNRYVRINQVAAAIEAAIPDLTTYAGWKTDHSLSAAADDSDDDGDGIPLLLEFALGAKPDEVDLDKLPIMLITDDGGSDYLELEVTRPIGLQGLNYIPQTATDLVTWPADSTGIVDSSPTPTNQGNGTEKLVYRRAAAIDTEDRAFIRLKVETN